jgi:hypothetical protein
MPVKREFRVGIGDTTAGLLEKNPFLDARRLEGPGPLRLMLDSHQTEVRYDDGDLKLEVCADRVTADGDDRRVDSVGIRQCELFVNDSDAAVAAALELLHEFERANPRARNLTAWYVEATDDQIEKFEGEKVHRHETLYQPVTPAKAKERFAELKNRVAGQSDVSGSSVASNAVLGVYEGRRSNFYLGVHSFKTFGGDDLSPQQERAITFTVEAYFRRKPYEGSISSP